MCLGHDSRVSGGVLVVSVVDGSLHEVCSAKVHRLGEKVGQSRRPHVHPQDSTNAAYFRSNGEVKWNLSEIQVFLVRKDAIEIQDVRRVRHGMGLVRRRFARFPACLARHGGCFPLSFLTSQCFRYKLMFLLNPSQSKVKLPIWH